MKPVLHETFRLRHQTRRELKQPRSFMCPLWGSGGGEDAGPREGRGAARSGQASEAPPP